MSTPTNITGVDGAGTFRPIRYFRRGGTVIGTAVDPATGLTQTFIAPGSGYFEPHSRDNDLISKLPTEAFNAYRLNTGIQSVNIITSIGTSETEFYVLEYPNFVGEPGQAILENTGRIFDRFVFHLTNLSAGNLTSFRVYIRYDANSTWVPILHSSNNWNLGGTESFSRSDPARFLIDADINPWNLATNQTALLDLYLPAVQGLRITASKATAGDVRIVGTLTCARTFY